MSQYGPRQVAGVFEGQIVGGKYRIERVLGAGGMGVVVAAHHIGLDDKVAIKFLLPEMLSNAEAVSRFAREARNAVKIKGEHMARVFDVGMLETGAPYMVMEFLNGADLHSWLRQRGPLPFEEAVDFVLQACEAIAEAHALPQQIIHRDLKPANLFCVRRPDGRVFIKVLDFGLSKVTRSADSPSDMGMTRTAALMGSPFYMSPEQLDGSGAVDLRTDIWALGVIIHELLTGKVPFPGETLPEVSIKIHSRAPRLLRESRPDAPEGLQAVVLRCLEKDPERRYRNVAELALALLPFAPLRARASVERIADTIQGGGLSAIALAPPPSSESDGARPSPETITALGGTAAGNRGGKRTVVGIVTAMGALAVAAVMAFALAGRSGSIPEETAHPAASPPNTRPALPEPGLPPPTITQTAPPAEAPALLREGTMPLPQQSIRAATASPRPTPPTPASRKPVETAAPVLRTPTTKPSATTPPPPPPAATAPNCNPPYVFDSAGYRQYKNECLRPSGEHS